MNEVIKELSAAIGIAAQEIVGHYVAWYVYSSLAWILLGIILILMPFSKTWRRSFGVFYEPKLARFWFAVCAWFIGSLLIFINIPDLLAPTGVSIHQLLIDIRG